MRAAPRLGGPVRYYAEVPKNADNTKAASIRRTRRPSRTDAGCWDKCWGVHRARCAIAIHINVLAC